jgi:hypothetical protein
MRKRKGTALVQGAVLAGMMAAGGTAAASGFEVWLVDQSNSPGKTFGGRLYVYEGADLMGEDAGTASPVADIDLGGAVSSLCLAQTGANPVRPHMILFNATNSHAVLAFVASGHVVIFDAPNRTPLACFRMSVGAGGARQAHAAFPSSDGSYILVANQNGKLLERIDTDYANNVFTHNTAATLNLATCTTPNGFACQDATLRPDNAPICPIIDSSSELGFVTLRGGGMFVVDAKATPMSIVAEYDRVNVHANGCGGLEAGGSMWINSGGATAGNRSEFDVYRFPLSGYAAANPPNSPARTWVFSDDYQPAGGVCAGDPNCRDSHGMVATKHARYLWVADRHRNVLEVFDIGNNSHQNTVSLTGDAAADPAPDLADIDPSGNRIFVSTRGPNPLTGDPHVATGTNPGLAVIQVTNGGKAGVVKDFVRITNVDAGGVERADAHGIRVRVK